MKILYVTQIVPYPPHGGVLQRGYNLLRELGKHHEIHLLAFHHPNELPHGEPVERSLRELRGFCRTVEYFKLWPKKSPAHMMAALALGALRSDPFSVLAHRSPALRARLRELCATPGAFDLVHLDTIALAQYAGDCGGIPLTLAHHNVESQLMARRAERERGFAQRWYVRSQAERLRRLEARVCRDFVNIMVSDADAETLRGICPDAHTCVVSNGVDTEYFRPRSGQETPLLVFTGGMGMFANRDAVHWFIDEIWPLVRVQVPEARFAAIGKFPSQHARESAARDPSIEVPGFVDDIRPVVARAAIYVVPMRVGGGTRLKVLDAMAQGKAIVSTTLGAEGIDATAGEHFELADDPASFAACVVKLLRDPTERARLGAAARKRIEEKYAWSALGEKLGRIYRQVTSSVAATQDQRHGNAETS